MLSDNLAGQCYNLPQSVLIFQSSLVATGETYQLCLFLIHSNRRTWRAMWALQIFPTKFTENLWREVLSSHSWLWVSNSLLAPFYILASPPSMTQSGIHHQVSYSFSICLLIKCDGLKRCWYIYTLLLNLCLCENLELLLYMFMCRAVLSFTENVVAESASSWLPKRIRDGFGWGG